jgi:membrane-associated phospholipid phosphatase
VDIRLKKSTVWYTAGFLLLLAIFTVSDLAISKKLFDIKNPFGNMLAAFGETPGFLVGIFSAAALLTTRNRAKGTVLNLVQIIGFGLLLVGFSAVAGFKPLSDLRSWQQSAIPQTAGAVGLFYAVLALILAIHLRKHEKTALRSAAAVGILLLILTIILVNSIKIPWGRMRMRSMDDPDSQFTRWFLPQGMGDSEEYKSFPSGHSSTAAVIIWITLIPTFVPRFRTKKANILLHVIAYCWIVAVMLSRIIVGAHFASDTLVGAAITVCCFYILKRAFHIRPAAYS